ncbi:MAG: RluA family pseudouridine synthase [Pseudomonadota bacterium]
MRESAFPKLTNYAPPKGPLKVLREGAAFLCVEKPSGLLSVPGKDPEHADCMEARVQDALPEARLVHRLDMDTSGVMIFARSAEAQRHLGLQFERRVVSKRYLALVQGAVVLDRGRIDLPLTTDWPNRPLQMVCYDTGRRAITRFVTLRRDEQSCLALYPRTGRSHQLRVHMKELGHPILGDRFYGQAETAERLMLHAERLRFRDPNGGAWITVISHPDF